MWQWSRINCLLNADILTSSIKQAECVWFATDHNCDGIIVKDSWNVFWWKFVGGVRDEEASFTDRTVADNNALYCLHVFKPFNSSFSSLMLLGWIVIWPHKVSLIWLLCSFTLGRCLERFIERIVANRFGSNWKCIEASTEICLSHTSYTFD